MTVQYSQNSPYNGAEFYDFYLDVVTLPTIPKLSDDTLFAINKTYQFRPDLLAFDLYGDSGLWWVFALRNPNSIQDPIFDFRIGKKIYLPKKETLSGFLR